MAPPVRPALISISRLNNYSPENEEQAADVSHDVTAGDDQSLDDEGHAFFTQDRPTAGNNMPGIVIIRR